MVRWWNVNEVTPSGLRLNRAWYIRQFLVALIPASFALILFESVSQWESRKVLRELAISQKLKDNVKSVDEISKDDNGFVLEDERNSSNNKFSFLNETIRNDIQLYVQKNVPIIIEIEDKLDDIKVKLSKYYHEMKLEKDNWIDDKCNQNPVIEAVRAAFNNIVPNLDKNEEIKQGLEFNKGVDSSSTIQPDEVITISAMAKRRKANAEALAKKSNS